MYGKFSLLKAEHCYSKAQQIGSYRSGISSLPDMIPDHLSPLHTHGQRTITQPAFFCTQKTSADAVSVFFPKLCFLLFVHRPDPDLFPSEVPVILR